MNRIKKILITTVAASMLTGSYGSLMASTTEMQQVNKNVSNLLAEQLPFMNSLGMTDATSGQSTGIIPIWVTVGLTGSIGFLNDTGSTLGSNLATSTNVAALPVTSGSVPMLSTYGVFGRVGIPGTDLDIGVKIGLPVDFSISGVGLKNHSFGGDVRYTILQPGIILPGISVAAGFDRMNGDLTYSYNGALGGFNANYTSTAKWGITNLHATVRAGYDILFLSFLGGLQAYRGFGDVTTSFAGSVGGVSTSIADQVTSASGIKAKFFVGAFFRLPLIRIGAMYDREFNSGASSVSFVAQGVF